MTQSLPPTWLKHLPFSVIARGDASRISASKLDALYRKAVSNGRGEEDARREAVKNEVLRLMVADLRRHSDPSKRQSAAEVLAEYKDRMALNPLLKGLGDRDPSVRKASAWALGRIGDVAAGTRLISALSDDDAEVAGAASGALRHMADPSLIAQLVSVLVQPQKPQGFLDLILGRSRQSLTPVVKTRVRYLAARQLESRQWKPTDDRAAAIKAVALREWKEAAAFGLAAVEPMIDQLSNPDPSTRWQAAYWLGKAASATAVEPLIVALRDEDSSVRQHAAEALGKIGAFSAVGALQLVLEDPDQYVRQNVKEALRRIGTSES